MSPYIVVVIYALAVMRVVGLITADQITAPLRAKMIGALLPKEGEQALGWRAHAVYLLTCPWCVSIYVGATGALVWYTIGNNPFLLVIAAGLAFSQLTGMFADVGRG
jgi:uncharacterized protein DUF1360